MRRKLAIAGVVVGALLATVRIGIPLYRGHVRRVWKEAALTDLRQRLGDSVSLTNELAALRQQVTKEPSNSEAWWTGKAALMTNGEWIIFVNICRKQDWRTDDLFLGCGSDGQWYYSTFHFCIGAICLAMSSPPASLAEFREEFFLRPFDGRSDECMAKTWP